MKRVCLFVLVCLLLAVPASFLLSQEREDRTLLNWEQMRAIINEASGERAMHHVEELVPYPRVRSREEYNPGPFRESAVMMRFARDYGFSNVELEIFPQSQGIWHAWQAELWMVQPDQRKLFDVYDVAVSVASGSASGDITGDLVDVGMGTRAEDYAGKDVKGKIVLAAGSAGAALRQASGQGAVGVLSYSTIYPDTQPDAILSQSVSGGGFGWSIPPRLGNEFSRRLAQGTKITLRSVIKTETFPGRMEVVHATIPGDGSSDQAVAVSGHLYEGYTKQGANDDNSGCAVTLEMGRTLIRLISEGKLPKPKRTIHFLWLTEISGTRAWLQKHPEAASKIVADLNYDMEGLSLAKFGSEFIMHRTPDTMPTFLNDLGESLMNFVGETNRERVRYRSRRYGYSLPILSPRGTRDPFYYKVDKYYGASDHDVYIGQGIPALMFITWPDPNYHSSEDTPEKLDSTQFKRVAVIGAAGAIFLAAADDDAAVRAAAESLGRGSARMGEAERKGLSYLADAQTPDLATAYREALVAIRHQGSIEKQVVDSAKVLFSNPAGAQKRLAPLQARIDEQVNALQNEAKTLYQIEAETRRVPATEPPLSEAEKEAASLIVERVGGAGGGPGGGFRGGAGGGARGAAGGPLVPSHMTAELNVLLNRKMTALEIRDFLSGEFEPLPLSDLMNYLRAMEKNGSVKLTLKPAEPPAPEPAAAKRAAKK
jgi:hypothetical protein